MLTVKQAQEIIAKMAPSEYYKNTYRFGEDMYLPELARYVGEMKPGKALEIGPGWGTAAVWLAAAGWEVTTLDAVDKGVYMMPALIEEHEIDFRRGDIFETVLDDKYDLVLCCQVLPHLKWNPIRALRNVAAMMGPESVLMAQAIDGEIAPLHSTYGLNWRAVPEYGVSPDYNAGRIPEDIVVCMYTRSTLAELLGQVFRKVKTWRPDFSTVNFAECKSPR